jgi:hypothetical protein
MKFGKILKVFKKGAKAAPKQKGKKGEVSQFSWPAGIRVGLFGHDNSGKTVYMTVLNEECKISKKLQISVTDNATAGEFLSNYRLLWGLGTSGDAGTVVDLRGEKSFPDSTSTDKVLQFNAILDRHKNLSVVSYDYNGKAVSITEGGEMSDKVMDFMSGSDGILFFFDPKTLGAELQTQAHVASFVNMLERLAPLDSRLPIPIALVIAKSDILPGFTGDTRTILIDPEDEHVVSENFELFLEKVLSHSKIASNPDWAGSVRNVLVKLREFIRVVVGRTLDFQIFFVSSTGGTPQKIGADVGRSIYAPPDKIRPVGIKEPFYWLLNSIVRNRRISRMRKIAKYATYISCFWIVLFSIPLLYHFKLLYPKPISVENRILEQFNGNRLSTSEIDRKNIIREYQKYENRWLVRKAFSDFMRPSKVIREVYQHFDIGWQITKLDDLILDFGRIVKDSTSWPAKIPGTDSLDLNERNLTLAASLDTLHVGDERSVLFVRSGRVIKLWELFANYIVHRDDPQAANLINEQIEFDRRNSKNLNDAERQLGDALKIIARIEEKKKEVKEKEVVSSEALEKYDGLKKKINRSSDPAFVFGMAVDELKEIRDDLDPSRDGSQISAIRKYLKKVEEWSKSRRYTLRIESVPDNGHLHFSVGIDGADPAWADSSQYFQGDELTITWKMGDEIYVAFDDAAAAEYWGRDATAKRLFRGDYAIFDMEGEVEFSNIGKVVVISFKPSLKEMLPKLK